MPWMPIIPDAAREEPSSPPTSHWAYNARKAHYIGSRVVKAATLWLHVQ